MVRIKWVAENDGNRSESKAVKFEIAKASTSKESAPVHASFCKTLRGTHGSTATFLVQPQDRVQIAEKLRPFVVTVTNPPDKVGKSRPRYRATVAIFYNNSALRVVDPSPVVEHTDRGVRPFKESWPDQDGTENIHFLFADVKVDYVGEYTMHASIFRPGDDLKGPAFLTTPWSTLVKVVPASRRARPAPLSKLFCGDFRVSLTVSRRARDACFDGSGHPSPLEPWQFVRRRITRGRAGARDQDCWQIADFRSMIVGF
jgi:hypothetical protein